MLYLLCMLEEKFGDKFNSFTSATLKSSGSSCKLHRVLERIIFVIIYFSEEKKRNSTETTLLAEPFFCLLDFGVLEKGSA